MRTSMTHPLQIAAVSPGPDMGRIAITFCPGNKQPHAATGSWNRQLDLDLDAIVAWGAVAILTLLEPGELVELGVAKLGSEVKARHLDWFHLPIPDYSLPAQTFEDCWIAVGENLRGRLRAGFSIVVHCKGGLGRAGMIAALLLSELGMDPGLAVQKVRAARPGAIETEAQRAFVLATRPVPEPQPDTSAAAIRDRAIGSLLGLALGDAVGTALEFRTRDSYAPLIDMTGGGPFALAPGEWTDDTSMALALADSLANDAGLDPHDLMQRFQNWYRKGDYSHNGRCFDIGVTTRQAIASWERTGNPLAGSTDPLSAGNGSLMQLAPVAIRHHRDRALLRDVAARQSRVTHAAPNAVEACVAFAECLADAIEGAPRATVLARRTEFQGEIGKVLAGSWRGKPRDKVKCSGYVVHTAEASFCSVGASGSFSEAIQRAANLGDDADSVAAVTGHLAGALAGAEALPQPWLERLAWREQIRSYAKAML